MLPIEGLRKGDVVQLGPNVRKAFAGCFMIVDKIYAWGARGFVLVPHDDIAGAGSAWFRAGWEEMVKIGSAAYLP